MEETTAVSGGLAMTLATNAKAMGMANDKQKKLKKQQQILQQQLRKRSTFNLSTINHDT